MQLLKKPRIYIILMFVLFPAWACSTFPATSFDLLPSPRGQTDKGVFDTREIGRVDVDFTGLARYQVISIIGVRPASSFFFDSTRRCPIIWWLPDPFADDLSVPWESVWRLLDVNGVLYQHTTKFPWESAWTLPYNVVDNPSIPIPSLTVRVLQKSETGMRFPTTSGGLPSTPSDNTPQHEPTFEDQMRFN